MERAYTVKEIDELRSVVETRLTFGTCILDGNSGWGYSPSAKQLEETVRTHMIAGHVAADVIATDRAKRESFIALRDKATS